MPLQEVYNVSISHKTRHCFVERSYLLRLLSLTCSHVDCSQMYRNCRKFHCSTLTRVSLERTPYVGDLQHHCTCMTSKTDISPTSKPS